jgi:hypothetical protein
MHEPPGIRQHHWKKVRRPPEQEEKKPREPGTHRSDPIAHRPGFTGVRKAGVVRLIGQQRKQQKKGQRAQNPQGALAQGPRHGSGELHVLFRILLGGGIGQFSILNDILCLTI